MFLEWMFVTAFIVFVLFMSIRMFYYRSVAQKEEKKGRYLVVNLASRR